MITIADDTIFLHTTYSAFPSVHLNLRFDSFFFVSLADLEQNLFRFIFKKNHLTSHRIYCACVLTFFDVGYF